MRIAVYAFDGITLFHLSIPQMVFGTVSRLGLADWQVSLFTTASESATPPEETVAPEEGASPPPPTAPSRTAAIRTSEGYILDGLGGPTSSWSPRGSSTDAPLGRSCAPS